jgi:hypothetical protein
LDQKIDALTSIVEKGFTAIADDIGDIREKMATKDDLERFATKEDIAALRVELKADIRDVRTEVVSIRRDLDRFAKNVDNVIGYRKEIDHALERIAAIEKHLGIKRKIAA